MLDKPSESLRNNPAGTRVDWLVEFIANEIVSGALRAGEKISEPRLSSRLGVSRAPLREAIRRLEERRLVTRQPRHGVRVANFRGEDFIDLLHMREGLEGVAARLAAARISDADLAALRAICAEHAAKADDAGSALDVDLQFHLRIAQASGSPVLGGILGNDFYALFRIWRRQYPRLPGRSEITARHHVAIVDALAARDGELAELLMRRHIKSAREAFEAVLKSQAEAARVADDKAKPRSRGKLNAVDKPAARSSQEKHRPRARSL